LRNRSTSELKARFDQARKKLKVQSPVPARPCGHAGVPELKVKSPAVEGVFDKRTGGSSCPWQDYKSVRKANSRTASLKDRNEMGLSLRQ